MKIGKPIEMNGNGLILYDSKNQQVIKLDANVSLKAGKAPSPPVAVSKNDRKYGTTYEEQNPLGKKVGPKDLVDPTSIISQNK
jgi:hypothetical protein